MRTPPGADHQLMEKAMRLGKHRSRNEALLAALEHYVVRLEQFRILGSFGTVKFNPAYDYKSARRRRSRKSIPGRTENRHKAIKD